MACTSFIKPYMNEHKKFGIHENGVSWKSTYILHFSPEFVQICVKT